MERLRLRLAAGSRRNVVFPPFSAHPKVSFRPYGRNFPGTTEMRHERTSGPFQFSDVPTPGATPRPIHVRRCVAAFDFPGPAASLGS